ncbi:uncharacterized protein LOC110712588 [Chenopodium quinoa]|uniref:uncharacterized protein LOC110712588 n=1 Tax=Chenopodium quinoa TaxID=63459 RepID=UPI000B791DFB|nr:uncharacterized protein LOC110712588 [Chenopodium quinoa]
MTILNEYDIYFSNLLSPLRNVNGAKSAFNNNGNKFVKSFTCPVKYEGDTSDIDVEAEEFIKQKLKQLMFDGEYDVKTKGFTDQEDVAIANKGEDEVYVDVKAEEFIKKKKSELRKVFMNAGPKNQATTTTTWPFCMMKQQ